ncbi:MAG: MFS transporter [Acholeplasma sp.]|nr:MFS transporter [Acholeplasma sp.]
MHKMRRKMAFASADIFGGGSFNIINFLYPGFLALTVGLNPYWIGVIMLVSRVWDAITDPIMGHLSDKTSSRFGKRRVYLIFASPLILLSFFLLFFPYQFSSLSLRIMLVLLSYLLFTSIQTTVMIPYYALSSEISDDYQERASYNSVRLGFSIFSSIICVALPGIIVNAFDEVIGYQVMSLVFGLIFSVSVLLTGLYTKPKIESKVVDTKLSFKDMAMPLKLKPFRQYLGMFLVLQMAMAIMSGLFFFYVDFYIAKSITLSGQSNMIATIAAALMFSMQIVALPVYLKMIEKKGKTFAYRFGAVLWIIMGFSLLFVKMDVNPVVIYVVAAIMGFGISGPGLVPHTMYGDVIDAGELLFNQRLDGKMSGFTNFINKIAQALGLAFTMFIIGSAGFKEQVIGEAPITSQPASALEAIKWMMVLAPFVLMSIGIAISYRYKINKTQHEAIKNALLNQDLREDVLESIK